MAGSKEIKRRIKSVKSTKKITKAMELVAASKMKRAVSATLASRLYAEYSWDVLISLSKNLEEISHPLFARPVRGREGSQRDSASNGETRESKNTLLIFITSNRGLCGAYNSQVTKKVVTLLKRQSGKIGIDVIAVGRKGDVAMRRIGRNIIATFTELPANISLSDVAPISKLVLAEYTAGKYDKVLVAYTDFISAMTQKPNIKQVLPISRTDLRELIAELGETHSTPSEVAQGKETRIDYLIEGNRDKLLGSLAEKLTRMQIYQMLLESNASEQSSRMVAMKNASEAAGEMIDDLTLVFNKARQAGITQEISEISAGMASVS